MSPSRGHALLRPEAPEGIPPARRRRYPRPPCSAASTKPGTSAFQPLVLASRHARPFGAEPLPAGVHDLEAGGAVALVDEGQLDVGRVAAVAADVPEVAEPARRVPRRDLAPVDLGAVGGALEDAAAEARFERDDGVGMPGRGVALRPPARESRRPDRRRRARVGQSISKLSRSGSMRHERLIASRRRCAVFSAIRRNRAAASPQTWVRKTSTASTPWSCSR